MTDHTCPGCGHRFRHGSVGARLILGLSSAMLAGFNKGAALITAIAAIVLGPAIDKFIEERVEPTCPECGFVIRTLAYTI